VKCCTIALKLEASVFRTVVGVRFDALDRFLDTFSGPPPPPPPPPASVFLEGCIFIRGCSSIRVALVFGITAASADFERDFQGL
jgi:hypothetical protein